MSRSEQEATKREKRLAQIRHLMNFTVENGCTQEEANAAFLRAQTLMRDWQVESSEVTVELADAEDVITGESQEVVKSQNWAWTLGQTIAKNFRCKVYASQKKVEKVKKKKDLDYNSLTYGQIIEVRVREAKNSQYYTFKFLGERTDSELCAFLFDQAVQASGILAEQYWFSKKGFNLDDGPLFERHETTKRKVILTYREGFVSALAKAYEDQVKDDGSGCTSLAVIRRPPQSVEDAYNNLGLRMVRVDSARIHDSNAWVAGQKDGSAFGGQQKQTKGGSVKTPKYLN